MAFSDAPCFRPTEQAVSAILSKISSISYSLVAPILTRVGKPEWSLSEMEIWKKTRIILVFQHASRSVLLRKVDEISTRLRILTLWQIYFLNLLYVYVFGVARFLPQGSFEGVPKLGAPRPAHLFLEPRKLGLGAKPDNGQDENKSEITDMA